ncbi:hypothetical protein EIN_429560 [Entamoeba invadens IP1]|uniref:Uncharacterized protein n=1 Tax=Entamoeba invadens IP1 TaxID=370355 RepID=A0A0A1UF11_ENTIV|nr:hypothetical protein EIN_429560 [Entamoeba invadens IP1]ELP95180.1 hypothetical protein EIN_429560 [Entamoeba invadens IP1]|eukprot:XP_004261951.1 hypothetical protein EIN_429560 [Entamoeba invadens IP1]
MVCECPPFQGLEASDSFIYQTLLRECVYTHIDEISLWSREVCVLLSIYFTYIEINSLRYLEVKPKYNSFIMALRIILSFLGFFMSLKFGLFATETTISLIELVGVLGTYYMLQEEESSKKRVLTVSIAVLCILFWMRPAMEQCTQRVLPSSFFNIVLLLISAMLYNTKRNVLFFIWIFTQDVSISLMQLLLLVVQKVLETISVLFFGAMLTSPLWFLLFAIYGMGSIFPLIAIGVVLLRKLIFVIRHPKRC